MFPQKRVGCVVHAERICVVRGGPKAVLRREVVAANVPVGIREVGLLGLGGRLGVGVGHPRDEVRGSAAVDGVLHDEITFIRGFLRTFPSVAYHT